MAIVFFMQELEDIMSSSSIRTLSFSTAALIAFFIVFTEKISNFIGYSVLNRVENR